MSSRARTSGVRSATEGRGALWEPTDVAAYLKITPKTLAQWRWRGIGPKWLKLVGGAVRYRPVEVDRWLDQQAQGGTGGEVA